jgi:hypothetical protein
MKIILVGAMLVASAMSSYEIHVSAPQPHPAGCAQHLVGKQVLGVGVVTHAADQPDGAGKYLVRIATAAHGAKPGSEVSMLLSQEQLCDLADSLESTVPGRP